MRRIINFALLAGISLLLTPLFALTAKGQGRGVSVTKDGPQRRTALVIGNSAYSDAPLTNPVNDARAVRQALGSLGFEVVYGENLTQREMKEQIRQFGEGLRRGGVGLFYFAGHGVQVRGRNYLIPVGAQVSTEYEVEYEGVDVGRVLAQMEDAGNELNIVILDACRNNPFARSFRSSSRGLASVNAPTGTLIAYATAPDSLASDGQGRNGLYTQELLKAMLEPGVVAEEVFKRVRVAVSRLSGGKQIPWESSSLTGDFYFVAAGRPARPTATPPPPVAPANSAAFELAYWNSIKDSTDPDDFKEYLEKYPNGQFVGIARRRIASLSVGLTSDKETASGAGTLSSPPAAGEPWFPIRMRVRADNTANGWTDSGLLVRRGQQLRVTASGSISLGQGRYSTPTGVPRFVDTGKLMRNEPTGGLIAVVGDDNDEFIFVGANREFYAPRDGRLFLGVNESNLNDNTGTYEALVEVQPVQTLASESPITGGQADPSQASSNFFPVRVRVRADNTANGWTDSGLMVRRGQRLRVSATGSVWLGQGRSSTPSGLPRIMDTEKLMRNQPTGALIAVVGDDNDEFVFVGAGREFYAPRDGRLFFGVNEGNLADNTGTFDVLVEVEPLRN
jgi:uncharacterized caspase-like protein